MINKKTEIATLSLNLFPIQVKNIEPGFNGDCISRDGGLLLFDEFDIQLSYHQQGCS